MMKKPSYAKILKQIMAHKFDKSKWIVMKDTIKELRK